MTTKPSPLHLISRVAASLLGGYAFVWGCVTLGIVLLLAAGMPYGEAQTLAYLLAFLVFLACFCWAYAAASLARVWLVLAGGGAAMTGAAWLLTRLPA
ncbi:iron uptake protein [Pseudoduganella namucuonensis]|uniref:iron uptake protein n=1 Tax=Pseudoduganella namucuonensis TaxID=1035707 RepID=UPI000B836FE3|nr:iron uptake protein [Pseudoduganella namucuonensis]